jgi:hypothetical protein
MTLFDALVDDAGLFPPTSLHMSDALARHRADLAGHNPLLTHRFLCPTSRLDELRRHDPGPIRLGLIVDTPVLPPLDRLTIDLVEACLAPGETIGALAARLRPPAPLFVEVPPAEIARVVKTARRHGLKVRCGGLTADAFPTPHELGEFVRLCVENGIRFKATAGLHHAVRHPDPTLGVYRHGFLNLVLATCAAVEGRDPAHLLELGDRAELVRLARAVPEETAGRARSLLVGYGSCNTRAPVEDLQALGLVPVGKG